MIGIVLNLGFVGVEAVAGIFGRSTALLADAGHNLGDVLGLGLAAGAAWMAGRPAAGRRTYGFAKATILATLINSLVLVFACGAIALEAVRRFAEPASPDSPIIIATALGGVVVNGVTALLFLRGRNADLNIRAAFLHMAQDAVVSLGVAASAALIWFTHWSILDPLVSLAILALILWSSVDLLSEAVNLSLDAAPRQHKVEEIRAFLAAQPGVSEVHDLHVWSLSTTDTALTAHLVRPHDDSDGDGDGDGFLHAACAGLQQRFGIAHATLQIESQALSACAELHD